MDGEEFWSFFGPFRKDVVTPREYGRALQEARKWNVSGLENGYW